MTRVVILALFALAGPALAADAPAPTPKPRPSATPRPAPAPPEPFDLSPADAPVDAPGFAQPDSVPPVPPPAPPPTLPAFDLNAWTVQLDSGIVSVVTRGEKREYATAGVSLDGPWAGLGFLFRGELYGVQDGGRLQFSQPQSFRAVLLEGVVQKALGAFAFAARGGTTLSVEGGIGAPIDSRLWALHGEAAAKLKRVTLRLRGGHDGAVGGWAIGGDIEVPVAGTRPVLLATYSYPLSQQRPGGPVPWSLGAQARITIVKAKLSELF